MKIRFIGTSDNHFEYDEVYNLIKFEDNRYTGLYEFEIWVVDKKRKIQYIPYDSLSLFNENWRVIDE